MFPRTRALDPFSPIRLSVPTKSVSDPAVRVELGARLARLRADTPARWGRMNCPGMLAHVADALRMALGQLSIAPRRTPLRNPLVRYLIIYWLPFPKGAPTAPQLVARAPETCDAEVEAVRTLLDEIAARPRSGAWPEHPMFGRLGARAWGVLAYKHLDHHLRQFGA